MKKTNVAKVSTQFLDQFCVFLRMCIVVFVGLDTAVESAAGGLLIVCTNDFLMRLPLFYHLEEPLVHRMNHSTLLKSNVVFFDRIPLS